jgi:hypothetical protein
VAKLPLWAKIEPVRITERGNLGVRLSMRWWAVPYLFLVGVWKLVTGQFEDLPDSCDGVEVVETTIE